MLLTMNNTLSVSLSVCLTKPPRQIDIAGLLFREPNKALNKLKGLICHKTKLKHTYILTSVCMYKEDLVLNSLQGLICNETQPNQIIYN